MRIPTFTVSGQVRTVGCAAPIAIAKHARTRFAALDEMDDSAQITRTLVEGCHALVDAARAAKALDDVHATLVDMRRALDGDAGCELRHDAVREARDLRLRRDAVRRAAPDHEVASLDELGEELSAATGKVLTAREAAWDATHEAGRVAAWTLHPALTRCSDVGMTLRVAARAGLLPPTIDRNLAFGPVADRNAPEGTPARNSADALACVLLASCDANKDRRAEEQRVGRELVARITALIAEELA
ncbi:hypothetical protein DSM104443_01765 [Usitatibacter rugosus]|uniref:Uncharacterized protein n=1 Tax=Usitatibacter rugosus TaxID=2732067 RepID=A0A6M4GUZ2_9PROT|nr:hypothetical protein [Usitatibacter rugosus]QJR10698.1 hypothetical protein DSM104443_01765 [Usitatibacter rugosus]